MEARRLESLIRRAQQRDPEAFDSLVAEYGHRLFGYLYRLTGNTADAEELLQEVFLKVVRMIERYQHTNRFDAWIFRIATNLARDRARHLAVGPRFHPLNGRDQGVGGAAIDDRAVEQWLDLSSPPPDAPMILREETDALQRALAELPGTEREVIMLRHFGGLTFAEIADAMSTPLGTALARSHRALQRLRHLMGVSS